MMDGTSLLQRKGGFTPSWENSRLYVMFMVIVSSWASSCITMVWQLFAVSDGLRPKFHLVMLTVETTLGFGLGMVSDLKCRKVSMKYSLRVMMASAVVILLVFLTDSALGLNLLEIDMWRCSEGETKTDNMKTRPIYNSILLLDGLEGIMNNIQKGGMEVAQRDVANLGEKRTRQAHESQTDSKGKAFSGGYSYAEFAATMFLFLVCCVLQSSSTNLYNCLNVVVVNSAEQASSERGHDFGFWGWNEVCFLNIGRHLSLFLIRAGFVSVLEFFLKDHSETDEQWKKTGYIHIFCLNLVVLLILIPLGDYISESQIFRSQKRTFSGLSIKLKDVNTSLSKIRGFTVDANHVFWYLIIPYWIIYYVQTSNNFHEWILTDTVAREVEWWGLYLQLLESALSFGISILLSAISSRVSPAFLQVYCFVTLSVASFGLALSTSTIHETPVKSFWDFVSAFALCHGVFYILSAAPLVIALYLVIRFSPKGMQSLALSVIRTILLTAPMVDYLINMQSFRLAGVSAKFLLVTATLLLGIIATGIFATKLHSGQLSLQSPLELLPIHYFNSLVPERGGGPNSLLGATS